MRNIAKWIFCLEHVPKFRVQLAPQSTEQIRRVLGDFVRMRQALVEGLNGLVHMRQVLVENLDGGIVELESEAEIEVGHSRNIVSENAV